MKKANKTIRLWNRQDRCEDTWGSDAVVEVVLPCDSTEAVPERTDQNQEGESVGSCVTVWNFREHIGYITEYAREPWTEGPKGLWKYAGENCELWLIPPPTAGPTTKRDTCGTGYKRNFLVFRVSSSHPREAGDDALPTSAREGEGFNVYVCCSKTASRRHCSHLPRAGTLNWIRDPGTGGNSAPKNLALQTQSEEGVETGRDSSMCNSSCVCICSIRVRAYINHGSKIEEIIYQELAMAGR